MDAIIVGAGFAGAVMARRLADAGKKVLVLEKRNHIGGNCYDYMDENGVNRHEYGPHIFHTGIPRVTEYLSEFTEWYPYEHRVLGHIQGKICPIPFNLKSIELCFDEAKAEHLKKILVEEYGMGKKVPILDLKKNSDPEILELADFIYENVFKHYTMKQWGYGPDEMSAGVTARVPVNVSYDDRYFTDSFQQMPKKGYTPIFEKMLNHPNITVELNADVHDRVRLDLEAAKIYFDEKEFNGTFVFTGAVDDLLDYRLGDLPYRSLEFDLQGHDGTVQQAATENYPTPASVNAFTRITEYKLLMENPPKDKTTLAVEYPMAYDRHSDRGNIPYYPIFTEETEAKYQQYCELLKPFKNIVLLGRLAEYKYYNMDSIIYKALTTADEILG